MALKFRKTYALSVDLSAFGAFGPEPASTPAAPGASVTVKPPFTLDFDVERSNLADANSAEFTVWGLGQSVRRNLYKDLYNTNIYRAVEFWGGYLPPPTNVKLSIAKATDPRAIAAEAEQLYTLLFRGNLYRGYSERDGGPWRTRLECQTGQYAYLHAHSSRSYTAGTPKRQIILDLISELPNVRIGAVGDFPGTIKRGRTYSGSSLDYLKELTDGRVWIDNERIYCLNDGEYIPASIPVISEASGLQGAPRRETSFVTVKMLFEPGLLVGQAVELRAPKGADENNGTYKVTGLRHQGTISDAIASSVTTTAQLSNYDPLLTEVPLL